MFFQYMRVIHGPLLGFAGPSWDPFQPRTSSIWDLQAIGVRPDLIDSQVLSTAVNLPPLYLSGCLPSRLSAFQGEASGAEEPGWVGDLDATNQRGFLFGSAPLHARPAASSPTAATSAMAATWGLQAVMDGGGVTGARGDSAGDARGGGLRVAVGGAGVGGLAAGSPRLGGMDGRGGGGQLGAAEVTPPGTAGGRAGAAGGLESPSGGEGAGGAQRGPLDFNTLFLKWKSGNGEGQRHAAAVRDMQAKLKELKQSVKVGRIVMGVVLAGGGAC